MKMKGFLTTMGVGLAVGALGIMMLPKNSDAYKLARDTADTIKSGAEKAVDSLSKGSM